MVGTRASGHDQRSWGMPTHPDPPLVQQRVQDSFKPLPLLQAARQAGSLVVHGAQCLLPEACNQLCTVGWQGW